jgi:hypothetical protein
MRLQLKFTIAALVVTLVATGLAHATLLTDHFGVNPTVTYISNWQYSPGLYYSGYDFVDSSFAPTKNTATAQYEENHWFGEWGSTIGSYVSYPGTGTYPSGEAPYDTDAYYFDNDQNNLYFAVIESFPSPAMGGIYKETRYGNLPVVQGDFAINLHESGSQVDGTGFDYNYGVNLTDEINPGNGTDVTTLRSNNVGNEVYHTTSGWYLGCPTGAVNPQNCNSFTNFDPGSLTGNGTGMTGVGTATVNWYQLQMYDPNTHAAVQQNNWNTYAIEITIPRSILPALAVGSNVGFQWLAGCRNDGNATQMYMQGSGNISNPEPGTLALLLLGVGPIGLWARRRKTKPATS